MEIRATPEELAALVMELQGQRNGFAVDDDAAIKSIAQATCGTQPAILAKLDS